MKVVGQQVRPVDWVGKTAGTAPYATDAAPAHALVAKVLRSPHPHARITRLDVSRARALPGVHAVITADDFGDVIYEHSGESFSDRPPMAIDKVLFVGQEIAAVAADTAEIAAAAIAAIDVRYRRLPALLSVKEALGRRARPLHQRESGTNVALGVEGVWGDLDTATHNSVASASGTFVYPRVAHACMEPNTTVAWWHDNRMELWTSSQAPHFVVHELARVLELELDQVVCRDVSVGGGFGSKSKISEHEALAAMLSMRAGQPVSLVYSREEEMAVTKPRHEFTTQFKAHVDANGRMCLFEAQVDVDNGAYNHYGPSVLRAGIKQLGSMYRPDAVVWAGQLVDTHLPPGGQFRGYGTPQTALALESVVDQLAEDCGIDPIDFRIANASEPNTVALAGAKIGSNRLVECLHSVRDLIGWDAKRADQTHGRGVGVAAGMHSSGSYAYPGGNVSAAGIEVTGDSDVIVRFGGADAGTGQRTVLAQVAAEILAVPIERVTVIMSDWDETPPDMGAWSSRGTHMGGHATRQAAEAMVQKLRATAADKLGTASLVLRDGEFESADDALSIGDAASLTEGSIDGGLRIDMEYLEERMEPYWTGIASPNISASYTFAAHAVEVEIDVATGELKILDYVAAHDIGRAINPGMVKGQIIGGAVQGLGAVLGEELVYENGRVANDAYVHYAVPRFTSIPNVRAELIEGPEEAGPFDAKSVGEMSIVPPAPAVLNAVYDAIGIRFHTLPLTPDVILNALREQSGTRRSYGLWHRPGRWQIAAFRRLYPRGLHWLLENVGARWARHKEPRAIEVIDAPRSVEDAVATLSAGGAGDVALHGGGTDVIVQRNQALINPTTLVLTKSIAGMGDITELADGTTRIGAAVTLREVAEWAAPTQPALNQVIETIASAQVREVATVGGNLGQAKRCWFYRSGFDCYKRAGASSPCFAVTGDHRFHHAAIDGHRCQAVTPSDLATVFTAMDVKVAVVGPQGARQLPISTLYSGPGEMALEPEEMIESLLVPKAAMTRRLAVEKIQMTGGDFALVSLAASVDIDESGVWRSPRFVFGALAPTPWSPTELEAAVDGTTPTVEKLTGGLDRQFSKHAHPLAGNEWKLDAAVGLLARIATEWMPHD